MVTLTLPEMPPTRAKPPKRQIRLLRLPARDGVGVFSITLGDKASFYTFHEIRCEIGGRGFAVHRLGLGALYHVRVGTRTECECECMGFLAHGHCKHILGLLSLIDEKLI